MKISGKTAGEKFKSTEKLLIKLNDKVVLIGNNKKNKTTIPVNISSFGQAYKTGDLICAYFAAFDIDIKEIILLVEDYPKNNKFTITSRITDFKNVSSSISVEVKAGKSTIKDTRKLHQDDRLYVFIEFPDVEVPPRNIWLSIRGEQKI